MALLAHGRKLAARPAVGGGSRLAAAGAGALLLRCGHALIPLSLVVREGTRAIVHEGAHAVTVAQQRTQQVLGRGRCGPATPHARTAVNRCGWSAWATLAGGLLVLLGMGWRRTAASMPKQQIYGCGGRGSRGAGRASWSPSTSRYLLSRASSRTQRRRYSTSRLAAPVAMVSAAPVWSTSMASRCAPA